MYLSAERLALANQTIAETFEQTSIAWQAIPHWDTGDPGQSRVRDDVVDAPGFLNLVLDHEDFQVTLVQTTAPTPDSLMTEVMFATTKLARSFDETVIDALSYAAANNFIAWFYASSQQTLLDSLIDARAKVEDEGYRAPSCLITNTAGLKELSALDAGYPITESLLSSVNVNSLHRKSLCDDPELVAVNPDGSSPVKDAKGNVLTISKPVLLMIMLGRRQLIPHGAAFDASPGEEPVDIAVSVLPSLEVVGETVASQLELSVRIRFALRIKDPKPLVLVFGIPVHP
jgi:hypothetical protein